MAQATRQLKILTVLLPILAAGCTTGGGTIRAGSVATPAPEEPRPEATTSPAPTPGRPAGGDVAPPPPRSAAVVSLQSQAADERSAGDYERSAATLERAIRIAPEDASLWFDLATVRLAQSQPEAAEGLARRAAALAGTDEALRRRADDLADRARRSR